MSLTYHFSAPVLGFLSLRYRMWTGGLPGAFLRSLVRQSPLNEWLQSSSCSQEQNGNTTPTAHVCQMATLRTVQNVHGAWGGGSGCSAQRSQLVDSAVFEKAGPRQPRWSDFNCSRANPSPPVPLRELSPGQWRKGCVHLPLHSQLCPCTSVSGQGSS